MKSIFPLSRQLLQWLLICVVAVTLLVSPWRFIRTLSTGHYLQKEGRYSLVLAPPTPPNGWIAVIDVGRYLAQVFAVGCLCGLLYLTARNGAGLSMDGWKNIVLLLLLLCGCGLLALHYWATSANRQSEAVTSLLRFEPLLQASRPVKPGVTWDQISGDASFKSLPPAQQLTVLHNYADETRAYLLSSSDAERDIINKAVDSFIHQATASIDEGARDQVKKETARLLGSPTPAALSLVPPENQADVPPTFASPMP
jgi:hypothetical protein